MTEATIGLTYKPKSTLFWQNLHFFEISTFQSSFRSILDTNIFSFFKNLHFFKISSFWKFPFFSNCPFFKISTFHDSFTTFLNTKIFKFCENLHFFLSKSPFSWNLRIQEYPWIFLLSLNLKYPHLSLLEIRKGRKGVVKSSINLQKMIYNWPREGRGRGHYHIHGRL